ncbi:PREDICTED: methyl-CpG-binding domain protein 2-like [Chinchilla lanigera]|uniref:methyl-CpG-binding domain protein 2-like n=1 Tax=Chinchilla lanigera TaxID=34839 RepID=UPI0006989E6D|nr:PREDICTED: methyl-CpG-binding domain protein 2-like [Chinchilla lanigera]
MEPGRGRGGGGGEGEGRGGAEGCSPRSRCPCGPHGTVGAGGTPPQGRSPCGAPRGSHRWPSALRRAPAGGTPGPGPRKMEPWERGPEAELLGAEGDCVRGAACGGPGLRTGHLG